MKQITGKVIINADDFGMTESCTKAIAEAFSKSLVTSTTIVANGCYLAEGIQIAKANGFDSQIGIHINVTEGTPLTQAISKDPFFCIDGVFHDKINRMKRPTKSQLAHLEEEITAQIELIRSYGINIDHLDSHHHIHTDIFFENLIIDVCKRYGIKKVRIHRNYGKISMFKRIVKWYYNFKLAMNHISISDKMCDMNDLREMGGVKHNCVTEVMVHPDYDQKGKLIDRIRYNHHPQGSDLQDIRKYLSDIQLVSFGELR